MGFQITYDMPKPIIGMIPPGGWHYYDGDAKITGVEYSSLIKAVRDYRAENHLPEGDVEGDVNSYICSNWPNFCHGVDMVSVTSVNAPTRVSELLNDITTWAKNILYSNRALNYVTDEIAQDRAATCLGCPHNVNWHAGCSSCVAAADRLCASIRQGRDTKSSAVLGGCNLMRHDNRAAIFFDKSELQKSSDLPNNCWLSK